VLFVFGAGSASLPFSSSVKALFLVLLSVDSALSDFVSVLSGATLLSSGCFWVASG